MARMTTAQRAELTTKRTAQAVFILGAVASVGANIVAANPTVLAKVVSGWPALALLLTVHLFQHAPRTWLVKVSVGSVAAVAAWISYWHIVEVATMAGENPVSAHLLPVVIDAMMFVASVVMTRKPRPVRRPIKKAVAKVTPIRRVG